MKKYVLAVSVLVVSMPLLHGALSREEVGAIITNMYAAATAANFVEGGSYSNLVTKINDALNQVKLFVKSNAVNLIGTQDAIIGKAVSEVEKASNDFITILKVSAGVRSSRSGLEKQLKALDSVEERLIKARNELGLTDFIIAGKKSSKDLLFNVINSLNKVIAKVRTDMDAVINRLEIKKDIKQAVEELYIPSAPTRSMPGVPQQQSFVPAIEVETPIKKVGKAPPPPPGPMKKVTPKVNVVAEKVVQTKPEVEEPIKPINNPMIMPKAPVVAAGKDQWTTSYINGLPADQLESKWDEFLEQELKASKLSRDDKGNTSLSSQASFLIGKFKNRLEKEGIKSASQVDNEVQQRLAQVQTKAKEEAVKGIQVTQQEEESKETFITMLQTYMKQIKANEFDLSSPFKLVALQQAVNKLAAIDKEEAREWVLQFNDLPQFKIENIKLKGPRD